MVFFEVRDPRGHRGDRPADRGIRLGRARTLLLAGTLSLLALWGPAPVSADTNSGPFAASGPFNKPLEANPVVDPGSAAMVARASRAGQLYANLVEFGIPIYTTTPTTPTFDVSCAMAGVWGPCPFSNRLMRIPTEARPNTGSDGVLTVIDPPTNTVGEYWQATRRAGSWSASWGAVNSLTGSGWGGASTGAGASRLAGVVRVNEIRSGLIPHAMVLQTDNVCRDSFRSPAVKTDGDSTRPDCIPEGSRLQLDPRLDLDAIKMTAGERTVARAMQTYGAYVIDRSGAPMSLSFERASDASSSYPGATYVAAGFAWDYYGMPDVPWRSLRVLAS